MGKLTTHVLDTFSGQPAQNLSIELWQLGDNRTRLKTVQTNDDGRVDEPLLAGNDLQIGEYELIFHVRDYFEDVQATDSPFLTTVPVRFAIFNPEAHYHVPLLVSPWSYTTYRGS